MFTCDNIYNNVTNMIQTYHCWFLTWRYMQTLQNYKVTWISLLIEKAKSTSTRWLLCPNHHQTWALDLIWLWQSLDKHYMVDRFYSKWTPHISHPRLLLQCDVAMRNPFLQNKSRIVMIWHLNLWLSCCAVHISRFHHFYDSKFSLWVVKVLYCLFIHFCIWMLEI